MDRENVITHLQIIHTWAKFARERDLQFFTAKHLENIAQWTDDTLNLLKEQEVKTGYWIDSAGCDKCSICGAVYSDLYPDYGNTHFCPNCGAKMEGR